jgi:hypothetical protein
MGKIIPLVGYSRNGQVYKPKPRVVYINEDFITDMRSSTSTTYPWTHIVEKLPTGTENIFRVYEKLTEIEAQRNPLTTDLIVKQVLQVGVVGAGTTQGAGTAITKYFIETTTIGAGATEAFTLDTATVGEVKCIINNDASGDAAKIFPAVGESINGAANNVVYSLPAGKRIHLVCLVAGKWVIADDFGSR